jgi:hypothetical protein
LVSASVWGTEGREFKSPQPDNSESPESQRFRAFSNVERVQFGD